MPIVSTSIDKLQTSLTGSGTQCFCPPQKDAWKMPRIEAYIAAKGLSREMTGTNGNKRNGNGSSRLRSRPPPDPTVLRPSISVSVSGLRQVVSCLENGTQEVREFLLDECNVIYECKTCLNMFRSHVYRSEDDDNEDISCSTMAYIEPESVDTLVPEPHWDIKDYSPSLSLLKEAGFINEIQNRPLIAKLKPDLNTIINKLKRKASNPPVRKIINANSDIMLKEPVLRLERISQTTCAMFQNHIYKRGGGHRIKQWVKNMLKFKKLSKRPIVIVGPDSKIIYPDKSLKSSIRKESVKENYNVKRIYSCVFCDTTRSKVNSIIAHIHREHGKSLKQAEEYRDKIKNTLHIRTQSEAPALVKTPLSYTKRINSIHDKRGGSKLKHKDALKAKSSIKQTLVHDIDSSDEDITFRYRGDQSKNGQEALRLKSESLFVQPNIVDKRPSSSDNKFNPIDLSKSYNVDSSKKHKTKIIGLSSLSASTELVNGQKNVTSPAYLPNSNNVEFQSKSNCSDGLELKVDYLQTKNDSIFPIQCLVDAQNNAN
ncbi:unnamed protein product [Lepeophtheirus salmonis]|uniref:(salmon louse) hypothetical protein n=1 Tax=Lepeophtheirus salmonis TaxID=72036 RepID=A0A7R8CUB7_LEPSM|nr:unnamed protein product [Lepeophtheirus salmonis]CAF2934943.1 unnamed protein product [Lepeophtheirus salmonis]